MSLLAYLDLASGLSGDMFMAALVDAGRSMGVDVTNPLTDAIAALDLGCAVSFVDDVRGGLACLRAEVKTGAETHGHRRLRRAIEDAGVPGPVRRRALRGLDALVGAEAAVHGTEPDDVHLHELGSADTAADLIGGAAALHALGITRLAAAPVPLPAGWVSSSHGDLPLPAPVTLKLLEGARVRGVPDTRELVTPTGAAILVANDASFGPPPAMDLAGTGVGGGTANTERPNICRVLVGRPLAPAAHETCVLLETNIDDQTPECVGRALEALMADGALDAWVTPIVMKKSRPAFLLSVLARPLDEARLAERIFRETTTLGVRRRETERWVLDRSPAVVRVGGREIRVKVARLGDEVVNVAPEFSDCAAAAEALGLPLPEVVAAAREAAGRAE